MSPVKASDDDRERGKRLEAWLECVRPDLPKTRRGPAVLGASRQAVRHWINGADIANDAIARILEVGGAEALAHILGVRSTPLSTAAAPAPRSIEDASDPERPPAEDAFPLEVVAYYLGIPLPPSVIREPPVGGASSPDESPFIPEDPPADLLDRLWRAARAMPVEFLERLRNAPELTSLDDLMDLRQALEALSPDDLAAFHRLWLDARRDGRIGARTYRLHRSEEEREEEFGAFRRRTHRPWPADPMYPRGEVRIQTQKAKTLEDKLAELKARKPSDAAAPGSSGASRPRK